MPSVLSYPSSAVNLTTGSAMAALRATVTPAVSGLLYTVSPALPVGLALDSASGTISGTPLQQSAATVYTIVASSGGGSASAAVTLAVLGGEC
jgi:hypothetical protein